MRSFWILLLLFGLIGPPAQAQRPYPVGVEFLVNSYTTSTQNHPAVGPSGTGGFVILWSSRGSTESDSDGWSVQGQRFLAQGSPTGGEFQVNTYTVDDQYHPAASSNGGDGFVVVWESADSDTGYYGLRGRSFASDGSALGDDFLIQSHATFQHQNPEVAPDGGGGFVVVWNSSGSTGSDSDGSSVRGRRFDSLGVSLGPSFQVNTYTTSDQDSPRVSSYGSGGFVVVWSSDGSSGSDGAQRSVQGQRFFSDGLPAGTEFQVNSYTSGGQVPSGVAPLSSGGFVVTWEDGAVRGQRFDSEGTPLGAEFLEAESSLPVFVFGSKVIGLSDGGFIVSLLTSANIPPTPTFGGQRYGVDGNKLGNVFVRTGVVSTSYGLMPLADGSGFVGSWGVFDESVDVFGQVFALPDIFADGFESGDFSAWSESQP